MNSVKNYFQGTILIGLTVFLFSFDLPKGWFKAGSKPNSYEMGIDKGAGKDGTNAATIKAIDINIDGFGTLMQQCKPDNYLDKRVRMTGYIKTNNVASWAGLWLRVDQASSTNPLSFDNMGDRPITGTTGWIEYEIVLDVPVNSSQLAYGVLLNGTGQVWFDRIAFEIVDQTVDVTGSSTVNKYQVLSEPTNLDIEE